MKFMEPQINADEHRWQQRQARSESRPVVLARASRTSADALLQD